MDKFSDTFIDILGNSGQMCVGYSDLLLPSLHECSSAFEEKLFAFEKGTLENRQR